MVHRNCDRPALNTVSQARQLRVDLLKPRHELHAFAPQRGYTLRFWRHQPPIISRIMVTQARQLRRQHVTHPQPRALHMLSKLSTHIMLHTKE